MKRVKNVLQLPEKFRLFSVRDFAEAQQIADTTPHTNAWYIERKNYKASSAYLILVKE